MKPDSIELQLGHFDVLSYLDFRDEASCVPLRSAEEQGKSPQFCGNSPDLAVNIFFAALLKPGVD